jgi:hypothetical protein
MLCNDTAEIEIVDQTTHLALIETEMGYRTGGAVAASHAKLINEAQQIRSTT